MTLGIHKACRGSASHSLVTVCSKLYSSHDSEWTKLQKAESTSVSHALHQANEPHATESKLSWKFAYQCPAKYNGPQLEWFGLFQWVLVLWHAGLVEHNEIQVLGGIHLLTLGFSGVTVCGIRYWRISRTKLLSPWATLCSIMVQVW